MSKMNWRFTDYRYTDESFWQPVHFEKIAKADTKYLDVFDDKVFIPQARSYFQRRAAEGVSEFNIGLITHEDSSKADFHRAKLEELVLVCAEEGRKCFGHDITYGSNEEPGEAVSKYASRKNLTPNFIGNPTYNFHNF